MPESFVPRGRYFEEFQTGDVVVSASRTITEADLVIRMRDGQVVDIQDRVTHRAQEVVI